jgi:hypothetical protein
MITVDSNYTQTVKTSLDLLVQISAEVGKVSIYSDLARRLGGLVGREWTWRYVQSVHTGSVAPSKKFTRAVEILTAEMDGMPAVIADTEPITVYVRPGSVHPNAIVIGDSKPCAIPTCNIHFVPRVPWQKYCPRCRQQKRKANSERYLMEATNE